MDDLREKEVADRSMEELDDMEGLSQADEKRTNTNNVNVIGGTASTMRKDYNINTYVYNAYDSKNKLHFLFYYYYLSSLNLKYSYT